MKLNNADLSKVKCSICGYEDHVLIPHILNDHKIKMSEYQEQFPEAQILSPLAKERLKKIQSEGPEIKKKEFDIENTFGVKAFQKINIVEGYDKPFETTPKVDPGYVFDRDKLKQVLYALQKPKKRLLFSGPTGSGKSSIIEQVCARLNLPFYRINFDSDITRADFIGQWILKGKDMVFQYGLLPQAIKQRAVLLLDEIDCVNPSVGMALQTVLEGSSLTITENSEVLEVPEDFVIFGTANTVGRGDESGLYSGTTPQNYATMNRWSMISMYDYLDREIEQEILIRKTGIEDKRPDRILSNMLKFANLIRAAFKKEECTCPISTRNLVNICEMIVDFGDLRLAYELGFLNSLGSDDREFVEAIYQRVYC